MRYQKKKNVKKSLFGLNGPFLPQKCAPVIKFLILKICSKEFFETCIIMNYHQYKKINDMNFPQKFWFGLNEPFLRLYLCLKTAHDDETP